MCALSEITCAACGSKTCHEDSEQAAALPIMMNSSAASQVRIKGACCCCSKAAACSDHGDPFVRCRGSEPRFAGARVHTGGGYWAGSWARPHGPADSRAGQGRASGRRAGAVVPHDARPRAATSSESRAPLADPGTPMARPTPGHPVKSAESRADAATASAPWSRALPEGLADGLGCL